MKDDRGQAGDRGDSGGRAEAGRAAGLPGLATRGAGGQGDANDGFCPANFACVLCPANASDPGKRQQIELRLKWTTAQREETVHQGLTLETARFDQDIRACHTMLRDMDLVER